MFKAQVLGALYNLSDDQIKATSVTSLVPSTRAVSAGNTRRKKPSSGRKNVRTRSTDRLATSEKKLDITLAVGSPDTGDLCLPLQQDGEGQLRCRSRKRATACRGSQLVVEAGHRCLLSKFSNSESRSTRTTLPVRRYGASTDGGLCRLLGHSHPRPAIDFVFTNCNRPKPSQPAAGESRTPQSSDYVRACAHQPPQ